MDSSLHHGCVSCVTPVHNRSTLSMRQGLSGVDRLRVPSFMRFMMKQRPHAVTHHVGMVTSLTRYNVATTSHVRGHW